MSAAALLAELRGMGVQVWADGGVVRIRPRVAPEVRERIAAAKQELLQLLGAGRAVPAQAAPRPADPYDPEKRVAILEYDAGFDRDQAEYLAEISAGAATEADPATPVAVDQYGIRVDAFPPGAIPLCELFEQLNLALPRNGVPRRPGVAPRSHSTRNAPLGGAERAEVCDA